MKTLTSEQKAAKHHCSKGTDTSRKCMKINCPSFLTKWLEHRGPHHWSAGNHLMVGITLEIIFQDIVAWTGEAHSKFEGQKGKSMPMILNLTSDQQGGQTHWIEQSIAWKTFEANRMLNIFLAKPAWPTPRAHTRFPSSYFTKVFSLHKAKVSGDKRIDCCNWSEPLCGKRIKLTAEKKSLKQKVEDVIQVASWNMTCVQKG